MDTLQRRWFQFSLRTLLVLMAIVSLTTGWVMHERREIRERREWLFRSEGMPVGTTHFTGRVSDDGHILQPSWHRSLFGPDPQIVEYNLGADLSEAGLCHLQHQYHLKSLTNWKDQLDDGEIERIAKLTNLQKIWTIQPLSERQRLQLKAALPNCEVQLLYRSY